MDTIYLDNNATTQPAPEVIAAMQEMNEHFWGNPSSVHRFGQAARQRVELARNDLATLINARDRDMVFTSGGTEANNLALRGVLNAQIAQTPSRVLITTQTEHAAIRQPAEHLEKLGVTAVYLPVDEFGRVRPEQLREALDDHARGNTVTLVSIHWANNETGIIQPIEQLVEACQPYRDPKHGRVLFHTDATQAVGKIPIDVAQVPVDLLTLSGHKFHGPKGIGSLYIRSGIRLNAQLEGGPQERERRGGTENIPGIIGLGVAAKLAQAFLEDQHRIDQLAALRDRLETRLTEAFPGAVIISKPTAKMDSEASQKLDSNLPDKRLWNTTNIAFPRLEAEAILIGLSERGLYISAGAACSSGSLEPSPVLLAMGLSQPVAHGAVRFSLCRDTTNEQIDQTIKVVTEVVSKIARTMPMAV